MKKILSIVIALQIMLSVFVISSFAEDKKDFEIYDNYLYYNNEDGHKTEGYLCDRIVVDMGVEWRHFDSGFYEYYFPEIADSIIGAVHRTVDINNRLIFYIFDKYDNYDIHPIYTKEQIDEYISMVEYLNSTQYVINAQAAYSGYFSDDDPIDPIGSSYPGFIDIVSGYTVIDTDGDNFLLRASVHCNMKLTITKCEIILYCDGMVVHRWKDIDYNNSDFEFDDKVPIEANGRYVLRVYVDSNRGHENMYSKAFTVENYIPPNPPDDMNEQDGDDTSEDLNVVTDTTPDTRNTDDADKVPDKPENKNTDEAPIASDNKNTGDSVQLTVAAVSLTAVLIVGAVSLKIKKKSNKIHN